MRSKVVLINLIIREGSLEKGQKRPSIFAEVHFFNSPSGGIKLP